MLHLVLNPRWTYRIEVGLRAISFNALHGREGWAKPKVGTAVGP